MLSAKDTLKSGKLNPGKPGFFGSWTPYSVNRRPPGRTMGVSLSLCVKDSVSVVVGRDDVDRDMDQGEHDGERQRTQEPERSGQAYGHVGGRQDGPEDPLCRRCRRAADERAKAQGHEQYPERDVVGDESHQVEGQVAQGDRDRDEAREHSTQHKKVHDTLGGRDLLAEGVVLVQECQVQHQLEQGDHQDREPDVVPEGPAVDDEGLVVRAEPDRRVLNGLVQHPVGQSRVGRVQDDQGRVDPVGVLELVDAEHHRVGCEVTDHGREQSELVEHEGQHQAPDELRGHTDHELVARFLEVR